MTTQHHSKNPVTWLWHIIVLLIICCLALSLYLRNTTQSIYVSQKKQMELLSLGYELKSYSDYLTTQVRSFAVTNNPTYLKNYWDEVLIHKHRDHIIKTIETFSTNPQESQRLLTSKRYSDDLIQTEMRSMKLITSAYQIPDHSLPKPMQTYHLSHKDKNLSPTQKRKMAQSLLYDKGYTISKQRIMRPIETYNHNVSIQLKNIITSREKDIEISKALLIVSLILALLFCMGTLWINHKDTIKPSGEQ